MILFILNLINYILIMLCKVSFEYMLMLQCSETGCDDL